MGKKGAIPDPTYIALVFADNACEVCGETSIPVLRVSLHRVCVMTFRNGCECVCLEYVKNDEEVSWTI